MLEPCDHALAATRCMSALQDSSRSRASELARCRTITRLALCYSTVSARVAWPVSCSCTPTLYLWSRVLRCILRSLGARESRARVGITTAIDSQGSLVRGPAAKQVEHPEIIFDPALESVEDRHRDRLHLATGNSGMPSPTLSLQHSTLMLHSNAS